jgi:glyoxylase-like metal-dependent hydrolase (beta-lactamase superfamily II)
LPGQYARASTPVIAPKVLAKLAELDAQLRLIVLTHYHFDHVGAADPLRRATGARVAIRIEASRARSWPTQVGSRDGGDAAATCAAQ